MEEYQQQVSSLTQQVSTYKNSCDKLEAEKLSLHDTLEKLRREHGSKPNDIRVMTVQHDEFHHPSKHLMFTKHDDTHMKHTSQWYLPEEKTMDDMNMNEETEHMEAELWATKKELEKIQQYVRSYHVLLWIMVIPSRSCHAMSCHISCHLM